MNITNTNKNKFCLNELRLIIKAVYMSKLMIFCRFVIEYFII